MADNELKHDKWAGTTYGSGRMHRWLINVLRVTGLRLFYGFTYIFVVPPAMATHREALRAMYGFFRKGLRYGRLKSAWMTYRNHCDFAEVVIDRFAMYGGKSFEVTIDGYHHFHTLANRPDSFVQLSSHIGNYEIAGYSLRAEQKRFNALVFAGEKESVMANRNRMFAGNNIRMIPMQADMSHLFVVNAAISDGEILSMPADRVFGSPKVFELPFLGHTARFPQGPFMLAAAKGLPMLFVAVMKTGHRHYHVSVRPLEVPAAPALDSPAGNHVRERARQLCAAYVTMLEAAVRAHPTQWYNYFDFWSSDSADEPRRD